ncbi:hypothetical protein BpHYR1_011308 [Brachionus plicatilis]|uniref:Uncharacterized protein n=1 Tax=Brachionus plicatilis TaxID=10195 RepID=A0A3M7S1H8_BRAPC|nr:hypothetical protein BpHYR1_011308 [Brachionus plicatilis]
MFFQYQHRAYIERFFSIFDIGILIESSVGLRWNGVTFEEKLPDSRSRKLGPKILTKKVPDTEKKNRNGNGKIKSDLENNGDINGELGRIGDINDYNYRRRK